ncbi:MAG: uroporphyrinogen-III synthase [Pseudomonadota bacterium]
MRILITRPEPGACALAEALRGHGLEPLVRPLTTITTLRDNFDAARNAVRTADALVLTSQRAVHALGAALVTPTDARSEDPAGASHWHQFAAQPAFSVGPATSAALRAAGWANVHEGDGRARDLPRLIRQWATLRSPNGQRADIVYPSGLTVAFDLAPALQAIPGVTCTQIPVYAALNTSELNDACASAISQGRLTAACTMSPEAARLLTGLIAASELRSQSQTMVNYALSPAIARELNPLDWRRIEVSPHPNSQEFVAFIVRDTPIP